VLAVLVAACQDSPATAPELRADPIETPPRGHAAEVRRGFILGENGAPHEVVFEVRNDIAIREGDIVIGRADEVPATAAELMAGAGRGCRGHRDPAWSTSRPAAIAMPAW
jgi:hypothetical protein